MTFQSIVRPNVDTPAVDAAEVAVIPATVITDIPIAKIDVLSGRRKPDPNWIATLADLFKVQGQHTPIEVVALDGGRFRLVFGLHRLEAAQKNGWKTVRGVVKDASAFANEAEIRLREITENLARRQLSVLDKAVDIASWRDIYEAAHTVAKPGRKPQPKGEIEEMELSAKFALNFSDAAQQALGISRRSVFHALKVASIAPDVRDRISLHTVSDNQSELLLLAAEPVARQTLIADILLTEPVTTTSVIGAISILDNIPAPHTQTGWEKLSSAFSRLKDDEQHRFFSLHEAAIARWMEARGS